MTAVAGLPGVADAPLEPGDLELVVRCEDPAGSLVGPHWSEIVRVGAGRTVVVVGTVLDAPDLASAVLRIRTAARSYARLDLSPADVLGQLDGLLAEYPDPITATCAYTVWDPADDTVYAASAGHPVPRLLDPAGVAVEVAGYNDRALGVRRGVYREASTAGPPGSTLLCLAAALGLTPAVLAGLPAESARACADVVAARLGAAPDGAVLVVAGRTPVAQDTLGVRMIELALNEGEDPTRRARAFCYGVLSTWRVRPGLCDDIVLAVSELVANALLHGGAAEYLRLRRSTTHIIVEVADREPAMPQPRITNDQSVNGRGLQLVRRVASRWGARPVPGGKTVWCEFDLAGGLPDELTDEHTLVG